MAISDAVFAMADDEPTCCAQPILDYVRFLTLGLSTEGQARFCMSLRLGIESLAEWYRDEKKHKLDPQAGFPFFRKFEIGTDICDITYKGTLVPNAMKPIYNAILKEETGGKSRDVVVKFVDDNYFHRGKNQNGYGHEVQNFLHS